MAALDLKAMQVKEAVEFKIFEVQTNMESEDVTEEAMEEGRKWLQPEHFDGIIEERSVSKLCGYPLCNNPIDPSKKGKFRFDHKSGKLFEIKNSHLFCSSQCNENAMLYRTSLDISIPFMRPIAKSLDMSIRDISASDLRAVVQGTSKSLLASKNSNNNTNNQSTQNNNESNDDSKSKNQINTNANASNSVEVRGGGEAGKFIPRRKPASTVPPKPILKAIVVEKEAPVIDPNMENLETKASITASLEKLRISDKNKDSSNVGGHGVNAMRGDSRLASLMAKYRDIGGNNSNQISLNSNNGSDNNSSNDSSKNHANSFNTSFTIPQMFDYQYCLPSKSSDKNNEQ